ncbi:hypothetical protein D0T50_11990 [Bacteroides sp. 214]|uniref:hypothetical protein n=1 Tax=Bacteroides sp. 214 TaxID=2302935 RepID=UPI0013D722CC|nr:hypothetical protein [Bacteroides sp. 214]NDW13605.1 hypothetical protein [Bacteroides sp. 214]
MNKTILLRKQLSEPLGRKFLDKIIESAIKNPDEVEILYQLTQDSEEKVSWRAAWACDHLSRIHPEWFTPKADDIEKRLFACTHSGVRRLWLSIIRNIPVKEPISIPLLNYCLVRMFSPNESIAAQSLYIKIAYILCIKEPELLPELRIYLENENLNNHASAVKACARIVLKKLS